ncbi:MAG TPA: ABC transporter permease [Cellulomonas sp.]
MTESTELAARTAAAGTGTVQQRDSAAEQRAHGSTRTPGRSRPARSGRSRRLRDGLLPWSSLILLVLVWWLASATGRLDPTVLPGPGAVLSAAVDLVRTGALGSALAASTARAAVGAGLGLVLGLGLGLVAGLSRLAERAVDKPVQMIRTIPFTAMVPLFIIWFGIGETPKVLLVAVGVAVPVYLNTFAGIRDVDARLVEAARVCGLSRARVATQVLLPGALPSVLVGVRFALGIAWVALIVAETLAAGQGIGALMTQAREYVRTDVILVCIAVYAALGAITDTLVRALERFLLRWRVTYQGD